MRIGPHTDSTRLVNVKSVFKKWQFATGGGVMRGGAQRTLNGLKVYRVSFAHFSLNDRGSTAVHVRKFRVT